MNPLWYDLFYGVALWFYVPQLFRGKRRPAIPQRFGFFSPQLRRRITELQPLIWLHAVSVGEVNAALPILSRLRRRYPAYRFLLTTVTATGQTVAHPERSGADLTMYLPFDLSFSVSASLKLLRPRLLIILETELWPNLLLGCRRAGVPVVVLNGRISETAFSRYRRVRRFLSSAIGSISLWCMQSESDADRAVALGAAADRVHCAGNVKFDCIPESASASVAADPLPGGNIRMFLCGSTHEDEEAQVLQVWKRLQPDFPQWRLALVPRHPERSAAVSAEITRNGFRTQLWSRWEALPEPWPAETVVLVDRIGVVSGLYAQAAVVFVGGSLIRHGGQNPIEPAAFARPILFGPHMFNFREIVRIFLDSEAAVSVRNRDELRESLAQLFTNEPMRRSLGERAYAVVSAHRGASDRMIALIAQHCPPQA